MMQNIDFNCTIEELKRNIRLSSKQQNTHFNCTIEELKLE